MLLSTRQTHPCWAVAVWMAQFIALQGSGLLAECRRLNGCKTGKTKITRGYNLPAQWVIHTVSPVWQDGEHGKDELLARSYRRCLELAEQHAIKTMAFPAISMVSRCNAPAELP